MNVSALWHPQNVIDASYIQTGFARCGRNHALTAHELMEVLARYHNAHERHVFALLMPGSRSAPDEELLLAFCAIPCTPAEVEFLCLLLSSHKLGSRQKVGECGFCGSQWKHGVAPILDKRSGFLWPKSRPEATDVDEFVDRVADFHWCGSSYSLKGGVRLALACLPEIPFDTFFQVAQE